MPYWLNPVLTRVMRWIEIRGHELALAKTKGCLLTRKQTNTITTMNVSG